MHKNLCKSNFAWNRIRRIAFRNQTWTFAVDKQLVAAAWRFVTSPKIVRLLGWEPLANIIRVWRKGMQLVKFQLTSNGGHWNSRAIPSELSYSNAITRNCGCSGRVGNACTATDTWNPCKRQYLCVGGTAILRWIGPRYWARRGYSARELGYNECAVDVWLSIKWWQ